MDATQRCVVLDQNALQNADVIEKALDHCCREGVSLLLPDGAFFEFSLSRRPLKTWVRCLTHLAPCSELVSVSRDMMEMVRQEIREGVPTQTIIHKQKSDTCRRILRDLASGRDLAEIVGRHVSQVALKSMPTWSNSADHKASLRGLRDFTKGLIGPTYLKALRRDPESGLEEWLSSDVASAFLIQSLRHAGASEKAAIALTSQPSVAAGFYSTLHGLAASWLIDGGLEDACAARATNDLCDVEYVLIGALARELVSKDKRLTRVYRAVKAAFEARQ